MPKTLEISTFLACFQCSWVCEVWELLTSQELQLFTHSQMLLLVVNGTDTTSGLTGAFEVKVGQDFYVVETQAPSGYALSPAVETVNIPTTYKTDTTHYVNNVFQYEFKDLPTKGNILNWFKLPKTGAAGVAIFALAGMCLVAAGIFVFMRNRKKEEQEA